MKILVNKMTTVMLFMAISIMKFVQSVCHEISIVHEDFVAQGSQAFIEASLENQHHIVGTDDYENS